MPQVCWEQQARHVCVSGVQLLVDCLMSCIPFHPQCRWQASAGREGKGRRQVSYCWDFEFLLAYSPDVDRLFLWAFLRTAGPFDQPVPAPPSSVGATDQVSQPRLGVSTKASLWPCRHSDSSVIISRRELPHPYHWNEVGTIHRLERTTANPLYLHEKSISQQMQ